jgi:hypothetical protein
MRRAILVAIPVLLLTVMLQTAIVSRIKLLSGNADLVLLVLAAWGLQEQARGAWTWGALAALFAGVVSGIPWYVYGIGYLSVVILGRLLVRRIWQAPLLAMFVVTLAGTLELLVLMFIQRTLFSVAPTINDAFLQIALPAILLNLLLSIPIHALIRDLAGRLYQEKATE